MAQESIELRFQQGSSNKIYKVQLVEETPEQFLVKFEYGGIGKSMTTGCKTMTPVPYETAKKVYDRLVLSKTAKGYVPVGAGVASIVSDQQGKRTTFLPQLLNDVTEDEFEDLFLKSAPGTWFLQTKHDGERRGIIVNDEIIGANRRGFVTSLAAPVYKALAHLTCAFPHPITMDGEDLGERLAIFDILETAGVDKRPRPFSHRAHLLPSLKSLIDSRHLGDQLFVDIPMAPQSLTQLRDFINEARIREEEGIVMRHGAAPYTPGRPNSGGPCLKLKFKASATVMITDHHESKRSVSIGVFADNTDSSAVVPIGNCTIPPNHPVPIVGAIVEVQYLYAYRGGSLFQPVYRGERHDMTSYDCTIDQLKYKKGQ